MFLNFNFSNQAIGYIIDGPMDKKEVRILRSQLLKTFKEYGTINLYLEDSGIEHFSLYTIAVASLFPFQHAKKLNKVAMVTDRKWIHAITVINRFLLKGNYRKFVLKDKLAAIAWIEKD